MYRSEKILYFFLSFFVKTPNYRAYTNNRAIMKQKAGNDFAFTV